MVTEKSLKISAVMSIPRLAFTDNMFCAVKAFPPLGINLFKCSGVFWDHAIANLLDKRSAAGDDYIFVVDYDTVFVKEQVVELIRLMEESKADAIFPFQIKRECSDVLMLVHPDEQIEDEKPDLKKPLCKAITGHFACTIIRGESLRKLPHPWFMSFPNPDTCKWEKGKNDSDITFWKLCHGEGWKVYQANQVKVGHMELMIKWPTKEGLMFQHVSDYEDHGIPEDAK